MDPAWLQWLPELIVPLTILGITFVLIPSVFLIWAITSIVRSQRRIADSLEELSRRLDAGKEKKEPEIEWRIER